MTKKISIALSIIAALLIAIFGYLRLADNENNVNTGIFPFEPNSFGIVVRINFPGDWLDQEFTHKTLPMLATQNDIAETSKEILLDFRIGKRGDESPLYIIFNSDGHNTSWTLAKYLKPQTLNPQNWQAKDTSTYGDDAQIISYSKQNSELTIYYTNSGGMAFFSANKLAIEQYLRIPPRKTNPQNPNPTEKLIATTDPKALANIYINFTNAKQTFKSILKPQAYEWLNRQSQFAVWDISQQKDEIFVTGLNIPTEAASNMSPATEHESHKTFPIQTINYSISNRDYNSAEFRTLCTETGTSLRETIANKLTGEEASLCIYDPLHPDQAATALVLSAKSSSDASQLAQQIGLASNTPAPVGQFSNWPSTLKKTFSFSKNLDYFTVLDKYIIIGSSNTLETILNAYNTEKTLTNWDTYTTLSENFAKESSTMSYVNPRYYQAFFKQNFTEFAYKKIKNYTDSLVYLSGFSLQTAPQNNILYTSLQSKVINRPTDHIAKALWATKLDTTLASKPALVENHYTHNNEILVQDVAHTLYLIDDKGQILWKKPLDQAIMGGVQQIDLFNNGKLQIFFNTRSKLYLIDRNGENVGDYPIKLPYPATNPATIYDYDHRLDFRILVACLDKKVYCLNISGKSIDGWAFDKTETEVQTPIQYFNWDEKDFLTFGDSKHCYILNRRGEVRIKLSQQFGPSPNSLVSFDENATEKRPFFIANDTQGTVYQISLDGNTRPNTFADFSPNHYFFYHDFDGDLVPDYIFFDNNLLTAYNQAGKKIVEYKHPDPITDAPLFFDFSRSDKRIGLYSAKNKKAYLIENQGEVSPGFPVNAVGLFTIGKLIPNSGQMNLITGTSTNYLYNYQINL
ncbi:MAG: hypothetical protein RIS47_253 [Bacteroidota bacterium]